ncbi:MAG: cell division protein FtsQ/DivIB [Patescibacteria group bacterium]
MKHFKIKTLVRVLFLIVVIVLIVFIYTYSKVKYVNLNGNIYSGNRSLLKSEIVSSVKGQNIFFISNHTLYNDIQKIYPFFSFNNLKVEKKYPNKISIYIKSNKPLFSYSFRNNVFFVSANGDSIKAYKNNNIVNISSAIKPTHEQILNMVKLVNDVNNEYMLSVSSYNLYSSYIQLNMGAKTAILTFERSIKAQVLELNDILQTVNMTSCKVINVEFSKVFCGT